MLDSFGLLVGSDDTNKTQNIPPALSLKEYPSLETDA